MRRSPKDPVQATPAIRSSLLPTLPALDAVAQCQALGSGYDFCSALRMWNSTEFNQLSHLYLNADSDPPSGSQNVVEGSHVLRYWFNGRRSWGKQKSSPVFDFICFLHCIYIHPDLVVHMWWQLAGLGVYVREDYSSPEFVFLQHIKSLMSQLGFISVTFKFIQGQALQIITKVTALWDYSGRGYTLKTHNTGSQWRQESRLVNFGGRCHFSALILVLKLCSKLIFPPWSPILMANSIYTIVKDNWKNAATTLQLTQ